MTESANFEERQAQRRALTAARHPLAMSDEVPDDLGVRDATSCTDCGERAIRWSFSTCVVGDHVRAHFVCAACGRAYFVSYARDTVPPQRLEEDIWP